MSTDNTRNDEQVPSALRRRLLNYILGGGTCALLGAVFYPVLRFILPPKIRSWKHVLLVLSDFA